MIIMFRTSPFNFLILTLCSAVFIITVTFWVTCSDFAFNLPHRRFDGDQSLLPDIECQINAEYTIACKKLGNEVYIPFSFLAKYFEIYGSMNGDHFEWAHSHGKINRPRGTYNPHGIFMYFDNYNVEMRDRVKCISGIDGVPISTQWSADGYFYATQIAQFGLAHYSKNFTDVEPKRHIIENADREQNSWDGEITRARCPDQQPATSTNCAFFSSAISLNLNITSELVLTVDTLFQLNTSLVIRVQHKETIYSLAYVMSDQVIQVENNEITYGIGRKRMWRRLTRDLFIDIQKGLQLEMGEKAKKKVRKNELRLIGLRLDGAGVFDNLTLSTSDHMSQFFDAAEWLVRNQNKTTGGWPIPVKRRLGSGFMELPKGWYSAMSQGHALSLLSRAYHATRNKQYLVAALNGLKLFKVPSYQGGIMTTFLGKYIWYEEYPTSPSSYVLNGFIYSLLGLYDLNAIAPQNYSDEAGRLYDNGMISLKKMLLLYDTGSGSTYDLRHFTLSIAPNLARWDYHATHVNQLLLLATIDKDPVLSQTAERWRDYMKGVKAQHN